MPAFTLSKLEGDVVFAFATDRDAVPNTDALSLSFVVRLRISRLDGDRPPLAT